MSRRCALALTLGAALLSTPTYAEPPADDLRLGVEALTDFPISLGGKVWTELPHGFRLSASLGYMPPFYVDAINGILVGANVYSQSEGDLVRQALQSSLVVRLHAGMRPFSAHGFYFEVGYGLVSLGGGASTGQVIAAVTGRSAPSDPSTGQGYQVESHLHMLDAELGWQWFLGGDVTLRAALGFAGTLGASTTIKPNFQPRAPAAQDAFTTYGANYLDDLYTSYVFSPVFTLALGFRVHAPSTAR
jgi:hypothetical protein